MVKSVVTKICKNCRQRKKASSFYKSKRSADGLTSLCRSCRSIAPDRESQTKFNFDELDKFEKRAGKKAHRIRREVQKFQNEYRAGHWEPAVLCLGRISEAQIFALASFLGVDIEFPEVHYLKTLENSHAQMSDALRDLRTELSSFPQTERRLQREIKGLIERTVSFSFDIQDALEGSENELRAQDSNFALKGIKRFILRQGDADKKSLFIKEFEPAYREIMQKRNDAAHAPRDRTIRLLKRDIAQLQPKVASLITMSGELLMGLDKVKIYKAGC